MDYHEAKGCLIGNAHIRLMDLLCNYHQAKDVQLRFILVTQYCLLSTAIAVQDQSYGSEEFQSKDILWRRTFSLDTSWKRVLA